MSNTEKEENKVIETRLLRSTEKASLSLRALYERYGYLPFKMSKFEEYDLYVRNKDFLVSENIITFNDTDGRLLALKPDVTLSIIKNLTYENGCKEKVYYNENVYRVSHKFHRFKEIMQAGLECIGDTDITDTYEAIELAAKSLSVISEAFVLDISHLGILSRALSRATKKNSFAKEATRLLAEKNKHELAMLCDEYSVDGEMKEIIISLADMYGEVSETLSRLAPLCEKIGAVKEYEEFSSLCALLSSSESFSNMRIDFSVVNDMSYYSGIVFRGFIEGIPDGVLSGGEYTAFMKRMGKRSGAVGFAVYLDMLDELDTGKIDSYDVDVLILYNEKADTGALIELKNSLIREGERVSLQKAIPAKLRYKKIIKVEK